jgi:hypothetical protein
MTHHQLQMPVSHDLAGKQIPHIAAIPGGHVLEYCDLSAEALTKYKEVIDSSSLTTRSMDRCEGCPHDC